MLVRCRLGSPLPLCSAQKHFLLRPDKLQPAQVQRTGGGVERDKSGGDRGRDENRKYGSEARQLGRADDGQSRCREERKERGGGASAPGLRKSETGLSLHWRCGGSLSAKGRGLLQMERPQLVAVERGGPVSRQVGGRMAEVGGA